jgi:hypothetical protein
MKYGLRRIAQALHEYAADQGWRADDYRVLVRLNEAWGRIHVVLVAKAFPQPSLEDAWHGVIDYLEDKLRDEPALFESISLTLRTFDQVEEGGVYAISPRYVDINDLFAGSPIE